MQSPALETVVKIGFIGAGLIGDGLARLAVQGGHGCAGTVAEADALGDWLQRQPWLRLVEC